MQSNPFLVVPSSHMGFVWWEETASTDMQATKDVPEFELPKSCFVEQRHTSLRCPAIGGGGIAFEAGQHT